LDNGCGGGLMTQAFEAVENLGGLETEIDYPYEGHADRKGCQLKKNELKVSISNAVNVSTDEVDIAKFLVKHGPLSVGVNANAMQVCYKYNILLLIHFLNITSIYELKRKEKKCSKYIVLIKVNYITPDKLANRWNLNN